MPHAIALAGPKGSFLLGNLAAFRESPLRFLERCAHDFGDFVPLRFLHRRVFLVNDPASIESILTTQARKFRKTVGYRTPFMRRLFGQGLLTSEGALWTRQRRLAQPAFHRERIDGYAQITVRFAQDMLAGWADGSIRDVHEDVLKLTTRVVVKTLFNADVPPAIAQLGEASAVVELSGCEVGRTVLGEPAKSIRQLLLVRLTEDGSPYQVVMRIAARLAPLPGDAAF